MLLLLREGSSLDCLLDCTDVRLWEGGKVSFEVDERCVALSVAFEASVLLLQKCTEFFVLLTPPF